MRGPKVVVRKYENRRLYDTSSSRYINLDDIADMIREGTEVQVVDAKTGEDLTRVTLTQIIVEDAKDQPSGLPLELLRQLIVASDKVRQDFMMWYLKTAFDSYQKMQDAVRNQLGTVTAAPMELMRHVFAPPEPKVGDLQRRIAELESKLQKNAKKNPKRRKKTSK